MRIRPAARVAISLGLAVGTLAGCDDGMKVTPLYNHANARVVLDVPDGLDSAYSVHIRTRRGNFGELDCSKLATEVEALSDTSGTMIDGPLVEPALTQPFYNGEEWLNPTPAMLAQLEGGTDSIIDVCIMDGTEIVMAIERDLFQAWDTARKDGIGGKADDPSGEQRITSPVAYGERCVGELGEIPFFEKTGEGEYKTYNCLDSTPIPMTATGANGEVNSPTSGELDKCDNPQYIYSLCEAGPRVATRVNEMGTRWTLLCRKSIGGLSSDQFNDIAMIGANPFTGKTCFFQNALYQKKDGGNIPHPADRTKSQNLWAGVHGGMGSGIQCGKCHDADPFIHTPWIDGAKDANGRPIVPKMGIDPDFAIGANDMPYAIVNRKGQGWTMPKQITGEKANACLKCHRMGNGEWATSWLERMNGTDSAWNNITTAFGLKPENMYWMPPEHAMTSAADWNASEFKTALEFIQTCARSTSAECGWKDVPETLTSAETGGKLRNPVTLSDDALAKRATELLGFNKNTPSKVCSECHAPNETTLRDWAEKTEIAEETCLKDADNAGGTVNEVTPGTRVENREFVTLGSYEVAAGSFFEIKIAGTGDIDLYVKRGEPVSRDVYDCRPFTQTSTEECNRANYNAAGPATFYVGYYGTQDGTVKATINYIKPATGGMTATERVNCVRLEPSNTESPFSPSKLGIYSAAAHLGWFQDTFKGAFSTDSNSDRWALEYGKFKNRVSMPKGNHPRLDQGQFDIVAEWFARGLPRLTTYIAPDTGPTSCTPSIKPGMAAHVSQMATQGWKALNRADNMSMYGCSGSDARACFSNVKEAESTNYGRGWANAGKLRVLRELGFNTYYWMRSSADGRFVANGGSGGTSIVSDLQANKDIEVDAAYDPGFFPDNKGWMFQGTPIGAAFCKMSLLTSGPNKIDFSESACSSVGTVNLYQHLGAGLGGGDYFAINSQFTSDNPTGGETVDPSAAFASNADMKLTPMVFDGSHYVGKPPVTVASPYEGDSVLSPSTKLVISRFGNESEHLGYIIRQVTATPNGNSYSVTTTEIGRYCTQGAKPSISFDEKFFVTHTYVGPEDYADLGYSSANDPEFQEMLEKGTANIEVVEMLTGKRTRITTMKAGQMALFPHFRSDGWIYFLARDLNTEKEYVIASDAALSL